MALKDPSLIVIEALITRSKWPTTLNRCRLSRNLRTHRSLIWNSASIVVENSSLAVCSFTRRPVHLTIRLRLNLAKLKYNQNQRHKHQMASRSICQSAGRNLSLNLSLPGMSNAIQYLRVEETTKLPKWKLEHQQLVQSIRYSREVEKAEKTGGNMKEVQERAPKNPLEENYVFCQFC
jgi:hypothetical protein